MPRREIEYSISRHKPEKVLQNAIGDMCDAAFRLMSGGVSVKMNPSRNAMCTMRF